MELWSELATLHTRLDALKHPFYLRWQAGELTRPELADYAGQYRHAVVALADASDRAAELDPALRAHAVEEREHVTLWDGFLTAMGGDACAPAPVADSRAPTAPAELGMTLQDALYPCRTELRRAADSGGQSPFHYITGIVRSLSRQSRAASRALTSPIEKNRSAVSRMLVLNSGHPG